MGRHRLAAFLSGQSFFPPFLPDKALMSAAVAWIAPARVNRVPPSPATRRPAARNAAEVVINKRVDFFMLPAIY